MRLPNQPKVLASTYNPVSKTKMISFLVDFPTVLLAELRTHRILTQGSLYEHVELNDFNLSANSARAIPASNYLEKVLNHPFIPIWTKQQKGMSGGELDPKIGEEATSLWLSNLENPVYNNDTAWTYRMISELKIHKQNVNRLLAPYAWTTCIISGTEWDNFWNLRLSPDTQPEFREIALMLKKLYDNADWSKNKYHIPFQDIIENNYTQSLIDIGLKVESEEWYRYLMKISASMCAKLSYDTQNKEDTLEKHLERADMLIKNKHWEPFSHQAVAMTKYEYENMFIQSIVSINGKKEIKKELGVAYNLRGFISQRYILENSINE